ncbi:hypothetical protein M9434_000175 [Picochlorum sp. BPE23]|nr:hypothetical protein M9434_000175 [Picochlorum sp. BPE23]
MLLFRGGHAAPTVVPWRTRALGSNGRIGVHSLMSSMTLRRFTSGYRYRSLGSRSHMVRLCGRGVGASLPGTKGRPGARVHVGSAAALGGEGGMSGGSVDDGRRIFILEDMTMDQLHDFHMRLCENDVEYHDLKSMCKLNGLGGKDMKYNLRAKLIRKVREMLGKPVWDKRSYGRRVKLPTAMSEGELAKFYKQREVVMPDDKDDAIGLAFAMLVVDGAISQDVVPTTSAYDKLNTKRLIQLCQKRNLPTKGNKAELLARLVEYDAQRERKILADKAEEAARRELEEATIDVPPRPPNRAMAADLREAQKTMASVSEMDLPYLRAALLARNLPVYGTSEVLVERLTNVLRRDVIDAHAGLGRLVKYAEAAVSKLDDEETYEALAARGLASFSVGEDSDSRLANALVEEWIHAAMMPNDSEWEESGTQSDEQGPEGEDAVTQTIDPTLDVTLICDGLTVEEREKSIQSAREILPDLQSDQIWGTLMPFTSSDGQENLEEDLNSFDCEERPADTIEILYLTPAVNGVVATVSAPMAPLGTLFKVYAKPAEEAGEEVVATGLSQDIVVKGLKPGTAYEFTIAVVNKMGEGPRSEPYHAATLLRQGVSVTVLYPIRTGSNDDAACGYTALSWEELYGYDAAALDAILPGQGNRSMQAMSEIAGSSRILLPLGTPSVSDPSLAQHSALNAFNPEFVSKKAGRIDLLEKTMSKGYQSMPVLELEHDHASEAEDLLAKWIHDGPNDSIIGRFSIEVIQGQEKLLSIVCRGLHACIEVIDALKTDTDGFKDVVIRIEPIYKDAVHLQVHVVDTKEGPVALVPTEIDYFDINDCISISDIEVSKVVYQNGEYDVDMLERVIKLKAEDILVPPHAESQDGDLSDSRKIRHHTPPRSIPVELSNHARLSAVRIFKDMGLKDFARISLIVCPEIDPTEMENDKNALVAFESGEKVVAEIDDENYSSLKVESMASLLQKEQDALKERATAERNLVDKDLGSMTVVDFYKAEPKVRYGEVFGVPIDDRTRLDIQKEMVQSKARPILPEPPQGKYSGLNDAESLDVDKVNTFLSDDGTSYSVVIGEIGLIPSFESKLGTLAQQLFASGLSWNWLPRQLVSMVAGRLDLPELEGQLISQDEVKDADEDWVGISCTELSNSDEEISFEAIKDIVEIWDKEPIFAHLDEPETIVNDDATSAPREDEIEAALEQTVATLNEKDEMSSDQETFSDMSSILSQQFPGLHPCRQRVWILCGGEGPQRKESLNTAAAAMRALQGAPDLLLEAFMLDPPNAGLRNDERLKKLVSLREDVLKSGATDDFLFAEMPYLHPARIKHPDPLPPQDLNGRGVWRLAGSNIVRDSVEDMRCSIDRIADCSRLTTVSRKPGDDLHKIEQILDATKSSFQDTEISIEGYRAPWGGSLAVEGNPGVPRYLSLKDWGVAASEKCAVILMVLPGHPSAYGPIQELMDEVGVPYTGPSNVAAGLCLDRPELLRSLTDAVNYDGSIISAPPAHSISALELRATCQTEESANEFFNRLFGAWDDKMMVIRPATDYGLGMLRMKGGKDLMLYNHAVQNWMETIDADDTTAEAVDIRMPLPPPTQFVIEPFLEAEPVQILRGGSHDQTTIQDKLYGPIRWPTQDNWLEAKGCLLGGAGTMRCLGLSTSVVQVTDDELAGPFFDLTPPPPSILSDEMTSDTMLRLQLVSDRLGLSGAAEISLLINAETGEIVITEVDIHPDISPNGLLMRQAAQQSPPMSHVEVMRELLKEAMSRGEDAFDGDAGEQASMYSADEFSASMGGVLDAPDAPNPTQNYFGDPYLKVEDGYQYGFEGFQPAGSEEEDEEDEDVDDEFDDFPYFSESASDVDV